MNVLGTEMHVLTLVFIVLYILMFIYVGLHYIHRPQDKKWTWYILLLVLLISYNIAGGLFPDPNIAISITVQNIVAYGTGFLMASYFPFYFYKAFDLKKLRFHAIYGVPVILLGSFVLFFVIGYSLNGNLETATSIGMLAPFVYAIVLLGAITIAVRDRYKENRKQNKFAEEIAVYCAVAPWASMPVLSYLHASQLVEVIFTNTGFIIITIIFILQCVKGVRSQHREYLQLSKDADAAFVNSCTKYGLSSREVDVAMCLMLGMKNKAIAEKLNISEKTVGNHVTSIYEKVRVSSRSALVYLFLMGRNSA